VEAAGESLGANDVAANGGGAPVRVSPHFHAAIELIGRRWTGAILWSLRERPHYFAELTTSVPGLSDRLLSRRLRELEAAGLVERSVSERPPARVSYALTEKGRALEPALEELADWAGDWKLSS
jgi:DNA-binding HxlR family transcriptional regulator